MVSIGLKMEMIIGFTVSYLYVRTNHREYVGRSKRVKRYNFDVWKREIKVEGNKFY